MQWLTADLVFDGYDFHRNYFLQLNENNEITGIQPEKPTGEVNELKGLLMPGMVNAHCHLELSHTKGLIAEKTGLSNFLQNVSKQIPQKVDNEIIQKAQKKADAQMQNNGIVAVGDICNTSKSLLVKEKSPIHYHSFIECIAIRSADSQPRFTDYQNVYDEFQQQEMSASLSLHTPYTCNEEMYELVNQHSNFISIHNQESQAENLLFDRKQGDFDNFYKHFGLEKNEIIKEQSSNSSFENSQRLLKKENKKLFVHNTFMRESDLQYANDNTWFCFCPKANLYIEDTLPDIPMFSEFQDKLVIGTDSLASNDELNVLAEVKTIQDNFPQIPLNKILQWVTINGARLFSLEKSLGSFEVGKKPGFVQVVDFDIDKRKLQNTNSKLIAPAVWD